jgi:hypothetical protein
MMEIPTLPSPTTILVGLVLIGVAFAGGAYVGKEYESGQNAKAKVEELSGTLDKIGKLVESDKSLAIQQAEKEAIAKERARSARSKGVSDAMVKANVVCDRDAVSFGLLNDAVDAANGTSPAAGVRGSMQSAAQADGQVRPGDPGLGVRRN